MSAIAISRPLVGRFIPAEGSARTLALAGFAILGSLILWASAKIQVPFYPVPMTLQTGAVAMLAAGYGLRLGLATVALYLLEGAFGLPVFAGGGGLAYLLGPTSGFLLGFLPATALVGWFAERGYDRKPVPLFGVMVAADAIVFLLGFVWLAWFATLSSGAVGLGAGTAFAKAVQPYILSDLVKLALAACIVAAGRRSLKS
jgi:biotin transport system substrate-specific component